MEGAGIMVIPKRMDLMIKNLISQHKKDKVIIPNYDEESEYMNLKWDMEHSQVHLPKRDRFNALKKKYECTGFFDCGCHRC